ncbi:ATP-binding protein [Massilia rhizosphaerae]|uniref:ATP-binding protein n=1 Tax=Massilia rhizosphaerae TaxID=2784389 RepID=UPI0018DB53C8|nr:ATP-binding protein [Massilia rhizosphaerae]
MDDSQGGVMRPRSLRWMLSASICGAILLVGIVGALASFWFAFDEARDLQDDELREIARLVSLRGDDIVSSANRLSADDEPEMRIWVIRTYAGGTRVRTPDLALALPARLADGLHTVESRGESWRLYARTVDAGHGLAVAQRTSARDEIARDSALRTLVPFLVVIPILIVLTAILIRVLLKKVREVADQVDEKGDDDFAPLALAAVPAEIVPFVAATNRLLERMQLVLAKHRQFIAAAAHELKSPITAMTLHLENAAGPDAVQPALAPLGASLERMRALVEQLLSLARIQAQAVRPRDLVDGMKVVVEAMGEVFPIADAKQVDLGLARGEPVVLRGSVHDFLALARNAIENAVVYTPAGGRVDVRLYRDGADAVLEVDDTGPGIGGDHLARVFDPFYRVPGSGQPGSGLGLAIVRSAASRLGGTVALETGRPGRNGGLTFTYRQPLPAGPSP